MYLDSDSDGDGYDNYAAKLQNLKKKARVLVKPAENYTSNENDCGVSALTRNDSDVIEVLDCSVIDSAPKSNKTSDLFLNDVITVSDQVISRKTRSGAKRKSSEATDVCSAQPTRRGRTGRGGATPRRARGRRRGASGNRCESPPVVVVTPDPSPAPPRRGARGRGRGRGARGGRTPRGRSRARNRSSIYTISIGNTDEYPDLSNDQKLFSKNTKTTETICVDSEDDSLDNEELSVKVHWQSFDVVKFNIRRHQKLAQIFDHFAQKEGVSKDRLLFTLNNKLLKPNDTPNTIEYNIANFIEGGIVNTEVSVAPDSPEKKAREGFVLKFQCQNLKKPFELSVGKDEKLQLAMVRCAEHLEVPLAKLIFEFDGENVHGNTTPAELEMDSGDCIDVKIVPR